MSKVLSGGFWNLKVGRPPAAVAGEVAALLAEEDLDFLAVAEAWQYDRHLARIVGYDYHSTRGAGPSERDAGVLVRHGLPASGYRLTRTHVGWSRRKSPGQHWPRSFPSVKVAGLRVVAVHMPDTTWERDSAPAYAECWVRLALHLSGRRRWVAPGDWNKRPQDRGLYTPRSLARVLRGRIVGGNTIDHVIMRGVHLSRYRRGPRRGSDHPPVLFSAEW